MNRFRNIYVEKKVEQRSFTIELLKNLKDPDYQLIDDYSNYFSVFKKTLLAKTK